MVQHKLHLFYEIYKMNQKQELREFIIKIIDQYYPEVELVLLAGSQLQPDYVRPQSDIDIVLIGTQFSGTSTEGMKEGEYSIDFTRFGYYNIQSILSDNAYDTKGTVIDMITHSQILKGDFNTYRYIRDKAISLNRRMNQSFNIEYTKLRRRLNILKKHFNKDLDNEFYYFMIMDFALVTSSMHLLLHNNGFYPPDAFRTVKTMYADEINKKVLNELKELTEGAFSNISGSRSLITSYIDKYLNHPVANHIVNEQNKRLVININYKSQIDFYTFIYNAILLDPYLSKYFRYSLENSSQYIFKNRFSLIFTKELDGYDELSIIKKLLTALEKESTIENELNIINPGFIYNKFSERGIYNSFEDVINYICNNSINVIFHSKKVEQERLNIIMYTFSNILARSLNLSPESLKEISRLMVSKWRPVYLFDRLPATQIPAVNLQFMDDLDKYYRINGSLFIRMNSGIKDNSLTLGNIQLSKLSDLCLRFTRSIQNSSITIDSLDLKIMDIKVLDDTANVYHLFIASMEMMMDVLTIKRSFRSKLAYALGKSYIK